MPADEVAEILRTLDDVRMLQGRVGSSKQLAPTMRSGGVLWIHHRDMSPHILSRLFTVASVANHLRGWNFHIEGLTPLVQATSYAAEGAEHYDWHTDWAPGSLGYRKISIVAHLSDPASYDGGTLQLTNDAAPMETDKTTGTVVVFPSFVLHRVTPVTRGRRLGLVVWAVGPSFA